MSGTNQLRIQWKRGKVAYNHPLIFVCIPFRFESLGFRVLIVEIDDYFGQNSDGGEFGNG